MITNQLLYQLSYTGLSAAFDNRKRKYYKKLLFCASDARKIFLLNIVKYLLTRVLQKGYD
jgi:hypothetical protein